MLIQTSWSAHNTELVGCATLSTCFVQTADLPPYSALIRAWAVMVATDGGGKMNLMTVSSHPPSDVSLRTDRDESIAGRNVPWQVNQ